MTKITDIHLCGYVRKGISENTLRINLSWEALMDAERYVGKDGKEYVSLVANSERIKHIINDEKEVTSVTQIKEE